MAISDHASVVVRWLSASAATRAASAWLLAKAMCLAIESDTALALGVHSVTMISRATSFEFSFACSQAFMKTAS